MKKRRLGKTDLELSVVGLGTFPFGGSGWKFSWGPQDDKESIETIRYAIDNGINWIDTAPVYGLGHSEEIVGKAIKGVRDKIVIATKCGRLWNEKREIFHGLKKESVKKEIEDSLRRLDVDVIDLYQIHWPQPEEDIEEAWSAISEAIKEGKIRYGGVSNFNQEQIERVNKIYPVASLQTPYSMLRRENEKNNLLSFCYDNKIGIVVYSPLQKGLLTGKFTKERLASLPDEDHRKKLDPYFQEPRFSLITRTIEELKVIAEKNGVTLLQLALSWILKNNAVTSALVGARNISQIKEIINSSEWIMPDEIYNEINIILDKHEQALKLIT